MKLSKLSGQIIQLFKFLPVLKRGVPNRKHTYGDYFSWGGKDPVLMECMNRLHLEMLKNEAEFKEIPSPGDVSKRDRETNLNRAIDGLDDELKNPLRMFVLGYKYWEIADILQIEKETVIARIALAKSILMNEISNK